MSITLLGITFENGLYGPWPEEPKRDGGRKGFSEDCIPGIGHPGLRIHNDLGFDYSYGGVKIELQLISKDDLKTLLNHLYSTGANKTLNYQDPHGNVFLSRYASGTNGIDWEQHPGFPEKYNATIYLKFISRTTEGTFP